MSVQRVNINADGTLDEIVGNGDYHLEDMGDHWFLRLGGVSLSIGRHKRRSFAIPIDHADIDGAVREWTLADVRDERGTR